MPGANVAAWAATAEGVMVESVESVAAETVAVAVSSAPPKTDAQGLC